MAKLSSFKIDSNAIQNGQWVRVGEEFDDLEIQTRGFTDAFTDARAAKLRRAAQAGFGGDVTRLPASKFHEINIECLISHCLLDVRNLVDESGAPVSFADFCALLGNPDYPDLYNGALRAIGTVGVARAADVEAAAGN